MAQFWPASRHSDHTECSVRSQTAPPWLSTVDFALRARGMLGKKEGTVPPLLEPLSSRRFMSASGVSWNAEELSTGATDGKWVSRSRSQRWHILCFLGLIMEVVEIQRGNNLRSEERGCWGFRVGRSKIYLPTWSAKKIGSIYRPVCVCRRVCEYFRTVKEDTTWYTWDETEMSWYDIESIRDLGECVTSSDIVSGNRLWRHHVMKHYKDTWD